MVSDTMLRVGVSGLESRTDLSACEIQFAFSWADSLCIMLSPPDLSECVGAVSSAVHLELLQEWRTLRQLS